MKVEKVTVNNHFMRKMQGWQMLMKSKLSTDPYHWSNIMIYETIENAQTYHEFIPLKMIELEQILEFYKPDVVIELGSGLSTSVINDYKPDLHIIVEESQAWIDKIKARYVVSFDTSKIQFVKANVNVNHKNMLVEYDLDWKEILKNVDAADKVLVYVDAPANTFEGKQYICTDFQNINEVIDPDVYIFDMRSPSVMQFYFTEYKKYDHIESTWLNPSNSNHHDIFWRF